MAGFTALALGLALGGLGAGAYAARRKPGDAAPVTAPGSTIGGSRPRGENPSIGTAIPRPPAGTTPPDPNAQKPPSAVLDDSLSTAAARTASARTRRRAAAGNAGKVTRPLGASQAGQSTYGAPRSLLGS